MICGGSARFLPARVGKRLSGTAAGGNLGTFLSDFGDPGTRDMVWSPSDPFPAVCRTGGHRARRGQEALKRLANRVSAALAAAGPADGAGNRRNPGPALSSRAGGHRVGEAAEAAPPAPDAGGIDFVRLPRQYHSQRAGRSAFAARAGGGAPRIGFGGRRGQAGPRSPTRGRAPSLASWGFRSTSTAPGRSPRRCWPSADVIFVMDELNVALLLALHPQAQSKLRFLGEWDTIAESRVIADPYRGSLEDVRRCGVVSKLARRAGSRAGSSQWGRWACSVRPCRPWAPGVP